MMRRLLRRLGPVGLFLTFQVVAVILVIGAEMVPDRAIADSLLGALDRGLVNEVQYPVTGLGLRIDRFSECVAMTVGLGDPPDSNNVQTALSSPTLGSCVPTVERLEAYRTSDRLQTNRFYFRYWHGYTVVTRPALALVGVAGLRQLVMASVLAAALALALVVRASSRLIPVLALLFPLILTTDFFDLGESAPHAVVVATSLWLAVVVWTFLASPPDSRSLRVLAVGTGAVSSFFEFMFLIPGTFVLLTVICAMRLNGHGWTGRKLWLSTVGFGAFWFGSFALTWATKWLVAAPVVGLRQVVEEIRNTLLGRLAGDSPLVVDEFGAAVSANFRAWTTRPWFLLVVVLLVAVFMMVVWRLRRGDVDRSYLILILVLSLAPLVWFEVVSNHSQIHFWFTYRALALSAGAIAGGWLAHLLRPADQTSSP